MKYTSPEQVQVGHWVTFCCEEDLFQITTQEDLEEVKSTVADQLDDPGWCYEYWETEDDAIAEIAKRIIEIE